MPSAEKAPEPATSQNVPASRYEAIVRLAESIRSLPDEKDLFRTLVDELHDVIEFDVLCQFDGTANWSGGILLNPIKTSWRHAA